MIKITKNFIVVDGWVWSSEAIAKQPKTKDTALLKFIAMTAQSWTFERLTKAERGRCLDALAETAERGQLFGNFSQRWNILQAVYGAFLAALDYSPIGWREPAEEVNA